MQSNTLALTDKPIDRLTRRDDDRRSTASTAAIDLTFADALAAAPAGSSAQGKTTEAQPREPQSAGDMRGSSNQVNPARDQAAPSDAAANRAIDDRSTVEPAADRSASSSRASAVVAQTRSQAASAGLSSLSVPPAHLLPAVPVPGSGSGAVLAEPPAIPAAAAGDGTIPTSVQAADLTRVIAAGTQVVVTRDDAASAGLVPPLGGDSIVALAGSVDPRSARTLGRPAQTADAAASSPMSPGDAGAPPSSSDTLALLGVKAGGTDERVSTAHQGAGEAITGSHMASPSRTQGSAAPANASADSGSSSSPRAAALPSASHSSITGQPGAPEPNGDGRTTGPGGTQPADAPPAVSAHHPTLGVPATPATLSGVHPRPIAGDAASPQAAAGQVSVHIARAIGGGLDRIEIQLSPASLGRVEVRLDIVDHHQVKVAICADTPDALEALRSDSRLLERALQDAGLKPEAGSLSFHLRDNSPRNGSERGYAGRDHTRPSARDDGVAIAEVETAMAPLPLSLSGRAGGFDIRA